MTANELSSLLGQISGSHRKRACDSLKVLCCYFWSEWSLLSQLGPPLAAPSVTLQRNSKTPAAFLMFDTTCRHTHMRTFDKDEHMHACIILLMPYGKVAKGHEMFWRLEELMACDLPATTMTLLTCYLSYLLITLADNKTHTQKNTHTLSLVCTEATSILAGVPAFL